MAASKQKIRLWLDDVRRAPVGWFWARNFQQACDLLNTYTVTECSLDHDLAPEHYQQSTAHTSTEKTGWDLVCWMQQNQVWPELAPTVHSLNPVGAERMARLLADHYGCDHRQLLKPYRPGLT